MQSYLDELNFLLEETFDTQTFENNQNQAISRFLAYVNQNYHHDTIIFMSNLILDQKTYIKNLQSYLGHLKSTIYDLKTSFNLLHDKIYNSGSVNASLYTSNRHLNEQNTKLQTQNYQLKYQNKHLRNQLTKIQEQYIKIREILEEIQKENRKLKLELIKNKNIGKEKGESTRKANDIVVEKTNKNMKNISEINPHPWVYFSPEPEESKVPRPQRIITQMRASPRHITPTQIESNGRALISPRARPTVRFNNT